MHPNRPGGGCSPKLSSANPSALSSAASPSSLLSSLNYSTPQHVASHRGGSRPSAQSPATSAACLHPQQPSASFGTSLTVIGTPCRIYPSGSHKGPPEAKLIPLHGDEHNQVDRFDVRLLVDKIKRYRRPSDMTLKQELRLLQEEHLDLDEERYKASRDAGGCP
eukprot:GHVT01071412.1.p1 GENE.GHVT01071412.1~~GHVT01071412.1.p1  ORF type:complete len:164 (+),score=31.78 GHVT01071412.1:1257-1748(+)